MLSWYDALAFAGNKKNLFLSVCLAVMMLLCFITTGLVLEKNFVIFSALINLSGKGNNINDLSALAQMGMALKQVSFWQTLYPKAIWITCLFISSSFVFFAQALIMAKKKLFRLPENLSLPFLMKMLLKLLVLFSPLAVVAYFYAKKVLTSVFAFGVQTAMNTHPAYSYPFSRQMTIVSIILCVVYLYYTTCLFTDHFSFSSLLKIKRFFKHIVTVAELIFLHIVTFISLFVGCCGVILIMFHLNSPWVCFSFLCAYLSIMIFVKNARFIFIIPVLFSLIIMFVGCHAMRNPEWLQLWPLSLAGLLSFTIYFVLWFMCLAMVAHLFAQTAFVFHFNKTASSDIKDIAPEQMRSMEEIYEEYLQEQQVHKKDNFFDHIAQITREGKDL